jgi:hypothetical protein
MPVPSTAVDISTTASSNSPSGSDLIGNTLDEYLRATQAILKQQMSQGADLASASTLALLADGNTFDVTGTTTISGISSTYSWTGRVISLKFDSALTMTHNATTLILPGGVNITTSAGDIVVFRQDAPGEWRCIAYQYASGVMATSPAVQNGSLLYLTSVAGTNTITATAPYPFTTYVEGQVFRFKAANAPTGAATININGAGAKALQLHGVALTGYEYPANAIVDIIYNGTAFQLVNSSANRSFQYTPTITNSANIDSSTSHVHMMSREWNIVQGAGELDFDSTAASGTISTAFITVPEIAANFSALDQASGTGTSVLSSGAQSSYAAIRAESGTLTLRVYFNSNVTTNTLFFTNYSYRIMG